MKKRPAFAVTLTALATLLLSTSLLAPSAHCMLQNPEVDVMPPEASIGQHIVVTARITVVSG